MMAGDGVFAQHFARVCVIRSAIRRVLTKMERAAMRLNQSRDLLIDLAPLLVRADRFEFAGGHLPGEIELSQMADVENRTLR